jgi:hypothetical protein
MLSAKTFELFVIRVPPVSFSIDPALELPIRAALHPLRLVADPAETESRVPNEVAVPKYATSYWRPHEQSGAPDGE